jgi:hypothetical protein
MTQHPAEMLRLPKQLREMLSAAEQSNRQVTRPSKEVVDLAFLMFPPLHFAPDRHGGYPTNIRFVLRIRSEMSAFRGRRFM